ncbi:hypothetical protein FHG87_019320 [Trinorchestia longiramus]|nr:hypothetical protein FHG87_019320 [Trinorchestia longiramus]
MAGGKSKNPGSHSMSECRTCKIWVDLESCKGLIEMSQSERNKLVFDCWKFMVDERVKMAYANMKEPASNEEYEWLHIEVNRDLYEKILLMKTESIRKHEVGSSLLDMDDPIHAGCFLRDGVHLSQEGETKLSQGFICWIRTTHLTEGKLD